MKKILLTLTILIGLALQSQAKTYYFKNLEGIVDAPTTSTPFPDSGNSSSEENPNLSINAINDIEITTTSEGLNISVGLSSSTISDFSEATLTASTDNESIITVAEPTGSAKNWEVAITRITEDESTTNLKLTATVGSETATLTIPVNIVLFTVCSATPLTDMDTATLDSTTYYLIGGNAGSSSQAKRELLCLSNNQTSEVLSANYRMTADVNFSNNEAQEDWNMDGTIDGSSTKGWNALGVSNNFMGIFDGNWHTIDNLYIKNTTPIYTGFMAYLGSGATLTRLGLNNVDITGNRGAGLVGFTYGNISKSYATGKISTSSLAAGVTSVVSTGSVSECYGNVTAIATGSTSSPLVGYAEVGTTVSNSYSNGYSKSQYHAGGVVGQHKGTVRNCYSTATEVYTSGYSGGVIGCLESSGKVYNSYAHWSTAPNGGALRGFTYNGSVYSTPACTNNSVGSYTCANNALLNLAHIVSVHSSWDSEIWDGLDTATPTLKMLSNF